MIATIEKYFPDLDALARRRFELLDVLYRQWNEKINVISRKDIDNLYTHHILHSLSIAKFLQPVAFTSFVDIGTGGGFPGIPLAILLPHCSFHLVDRIRKKIAVVDAVVEALGLENVTTQAGDMGECRLKFDFAVSRAAMKIDELYMIAKRNIARRKPRNSYPNGVIALKGGDLVPELARLRTEFFEEPLSLWFNEPFFETKKLIYIPV